MVSIVRSTKVGLVGCEGQMGVKKSIRDFVWLVFLKSGCLEHRQEVLNVTLRGILRKGVRRLAGREDWRRCVRFAGAELASQLSISCFPVRKDSTVMFVFWVAMMKNTRNTNTLGFSGGFLRLV